MGIVPTVRRVEVLSVRVVCVCGNFVICSDNIVTLQMVHSISLDKSAQSTFTKAVKNIKALIKVNMF